MATEQWQWNVGKESLYLYCIDVSGSMRLATDGSAWQGKSRLEVAVAHVKYYPTRLAILQSPN
jgi:hypothetical protein